MRRFAHGDVLEMDGEGDVPGSAGACSRGWAGHAHPGELAQELAIVLLLARHGAQVHGKVRALDAPQLRVGVKLHAHLVGRALPLLLGPI